MSIQRMSLSVSLTPALKRFITARVTSGRYQTAGEVAPAGLRLLQAAERTKLATDVPPRAAPRVRRAGA